MALASAGVLATGHDADASENDNQKDIPMNVMSDSKYTAQTNESEQATNEETESEVNEQDQVDESGLRKAQATQSNSAINNQIKNTNYKVPEYEQDFSNYLPKSAYQNGVGNPEGIILHDTANPNSTIDGEIAYMKNNWQDAFVHAYVDGDRVVETAPTDYLSWGAGQEGNAHFVQVELVHEQDPERFARSINNYADYAATNLQYYGLSPDSAEQDGQGTVWTHNAISNFLGGTDHTDPHAYLESHGYSYNELYRESPKKLTLL